MLEAKKPVAELAEADTTFNEEAEEVTRDSEQKHQTTTSTAPAVPPTQGQPVVQHGGLLYLFVL